MSRFLVILLSAALVPSSAFVAPGAPRPALRSASQVEQMQRVEMIEEPSTFPFGAVAMASVLGLMVGLASGPQVAMAEDAPAAPVMDKKAKLKAEVEKAQAAFSKNAKSKDDRLKEQMKQLEDFSKTATTNKAKDDRLNIQYVCDPFMKKCVNPAWNVTEMYVQCPEDRADPSTWGAQCKLDRDLVVVDDIKLTDLSLLANLQTVGGNVEIRYNAQLADISGLSNLEVIGGSLNIYFNHRLREISGFTKLTVIGRSLGIHHNDQLENITGMPSLRALGGDVEVIFNPLMQTVDDMVGALEMIEGNFLIKARLTTDDVMAKDNDNLTTLALLPNITRIAKRFEVSYNERITEVHGPPQLEQLGALTIKSNNALRLVDGFDRLQLIEGTFQVMFNTKLESLSFPHLESVGNLTLLDNDNLTEASFPGLWSVAGEVKVSYHARLRAFSSNASSAAGISFLANYELLEVSMPNLTHVHGKLAISFNSDLEYLDGFDALEKVDENLEIIGNRKLKDISTFKELNFIGKDFLVDNNTALTDLSGLTPKLKVHGNMEIENNDQLFSISGLETLPFVSGYAVLSIKCSGNAVRPPNRASCVNCAAWEMPSEDKASCQLDYVFVVVVGFVYLLTNVMVVDAIIMSSNGRVLLRTTERHYLLRGFWGRSFPLWVDGTGCSFIDQAEQPIQAKAVGDVELELMVRMEQKTYNRRTLSSLPHSEVSVQRTIDSTMGFQKTDGSCMLSCQGFAVVKSPWELLSAGFCMPCIVWALGFSLALFGLIYLGVTTAADAWQNGWGPFALGAFLALLLRLLGVLRRRHQQQSRRQQLRELQLLSDLEKAVWEGDDDALSRVQKGLAGRGWTQQRFQNHVQQMSTPFALCEDAGVSVAYILSREFLELSQNRSGKDDPNFYDLKDAFFLPSDPVAQPPIGGTVLCPRDGRPGALPRRRTRRTHRPFADVAVHRDGTLGLSTRSQAVLWSIPWSDSIAGSARTSSPGPGAIR
eukprot:g5030.t2